MPIATVTEASENIPLKSCPPDGFVVIRRMNYGESLKRKDMMASIAMSMDTSKKGPQETKMQMDLLQEKTSLWEFSNLILEHNLTKLVNSKGQPCKKDDPDAREMPLNFKIPSDIQMISGQVGDEIQMHIDRLNSFEESEETKN